MFRIFILSLFSIIFFQSNIIYSKIIVIGNLKFIVQMKNNLSLPGCGLFGHFERISNGQDSIDGSYPFAALLYRYQAPFGGAVIINERWLLSAAHNFYESKQPSIYQIGVGSIYLKRLIMKKVDKIIVHEKYQHHQKYDLALIRLKEPLKFGQNIRPICLPEYSFESLNDLKRGRAIGWGYRNFSGSKVSEILQEVDLDIIPLKKCRQIYSKLDQDIIHSQICTYTKNKDECSGDSGGPFFAYKNDQAILFGIIGFGVTCADEFPGVNTAVSHFLNWIHRILMENH
uniref:Clotting factor B-like n=1 Tax=Dermatophagoides pteronyssinus TaxID=6956 RepID=A0A6P6Y529_DERPT|nr:clotting factor B-like [Dermatophagoides pteronyssinus]